MRKPSPTGTMALVLLCAAVLYAGVIPATAQLVEGANTCGADVNTPPSTIDPGTQGNRIRDAIRCLINAQRTSPRRRMAALADNANLARAADRHAQEAARLKWWGPGADPHVHPNIGPRTRNEAIAERIRLAGYCPGGATVTSEIAYTGTGNDTTQFLSHCPLVACSTPAAAVNWWMNISMAGHREAILHPITTEIGVGFSREGADSTVAPQREMGTYVVNFGACPSVPPVTTTPMPGGQRPSVSVKFENMHINDCPEIGRCDWKLACGLGNQPLTEFFNHTEAQTGADRLIDRALSQEGKLPVTVTCTVHERDGPFLFDDPVWEHVGTCNEDFYSWS